MYYEQGSLKEGDILKDHDGYEWRVVEDKYETREGELGALVCCDELEEETILLYY